MPEDFDPDEAITRAARSALMDRLGLTEVPVDVLDYGLYRGYVEWSMQPTALGRSESIQALRVLCDKFEDDGGDPAILSRARHLVSAQVIKEAYKLAKEDQEVAGRVALAMTG